MFIFNYFSPYTWRKSKRERKTIVASFISGTLAYCILWLFKPCELFINHYSTELLIMLQFICPNQELVAEVIDLETFC